MTGWRQRVLRRYRPGLLIDMSPIYKGRMCRTSSCRQEMQIGKYLNRKAFPRQSDLFDRALIEAPQPYRQAVEVTQKLPTQVVLLPRQPEWIQTFSSRS